jgi:cation:H+ antiporter
MDALSLIYHILIFLAGLLLLVKGADYFVEHAARFGKRIGISDFVIGLTITSIGTSVPELVTAVTASSKAYSDLIIGNVVGSNIANIGLILGVSAALGSFSAEKKFYYRDGFIMIASVIMFFIFANNNMISYAESLILLLMYFFYILFLINSDEERKKYQFRHFMKYIFQFEYISPIRDQISRIALRKPAGQRTRPELEALKLFKTDTLKDLAVVVIAGVALFIGSRFLVREAIWMADLLKVPDSLIGLSMVAIGTSLPELAVSISAVRRGKGGIVVGNVIGSNIANLLLITGIAGVIHPMKVSEISVTYSIPIMLFFSLAFLYFIKANWEIRRKQGVIAILAYVAYLVVAFVLIWS